MFPDAKYFSMTQKPIFLLRYSYNNIRTVAGEGDLRRCAIVWQITDIISHASFTFSENNLIQKKIGGLRINRPSIM